MEQAESSTVDEFVETAAVEDWESHQYDLERVVVLATPTYSEKLDSGRTASGTVLSHRGLNCCPADKDFSQSFVDVQEILWTERIEAGQEEVPYPTYQRDWSTVSRNSLVLDRMISQNQG